MKFDAKKVEVVVAPMFIHIPSTKAMLNQNIQVCSQNVSATSSGAFTGEVSAEQIKDFGLNWVIIGHSERRALFGESIETVAKKVDRAQESVGLNAIVCIGETLEEREGGQTNSVLKLQLDGVKASVKDWSRIELAYEPVWAIGTGKTATPEQAQETHEFIRKWIKDNAGDTVANQTRIIYGGSVNDTNAESLIVHKDIDGFLVGGASLKPAFAHIVEACNNKH